MTPPLPLAGTRVVALEHSVAGPLCSRILADLGASVVKVERPSGGDFSRHWDGNVAGEGAQFWWLNTDKQSVVVDLKTSPGRQAFDELLADADVFISNLSPAAADRLEITTPAFVERFPRLIHCQISGYGATSAYRDRKAYDMLVQAETGAMSITGSEAEPSRIGVSLCDVGTGLYAAILVLAGLRERDLTGRGRHLDVAMFDATLEFLGPMLLSYANSGVVYPRLPDRHHAIAPYGRFRCRDGEFVLVAIEQDVEWRRFCERLLGRPDIADDARFASNSGWLEHRAEIDALAAEGFARLSVQEATATLDELGLAYGRLNDIVSVREHPVLAERGILVDATTATGAPAVALAGLARRLFDIPPGTRTRPPDLGEDTGDVLCTLRADTPAGDAEASSDGVHPPGASAKER